MSAPGVFIVFEGIDGSGKSTQLRALSQRLQQYGIDPVVIREPGGTPVGEHIRQILLERPVGMEPLTELFLYEASRSELTRTVLRPALEAGRVVLSDRFAMASLAYQGYGRGLDFTLVQKFNTIATDGIEPSLTIILDVPVEVALARKRQAFDRLERAGREFHERVRRGYQELARHAPQNTLLLDGTRSESELAEQIWQRVQALLIFTPSPEG
ncbi:Thymidylate kinase [bacterium HR07]|uniref:Thymidylate kinase n=1 Tax=Acetithermum autotrophicum TaxID=1446466 RepID=H5STM7_ACEAU|nr:dTMP kinase [Candidatus Acetothermum autotrophicum]GBC75884.1 Thymidylate kinase [bacterium HR07]